MYKKFDNNVELLCYVKPGLNPWTQWKFAISASMIKPTIKWFHLVMGHPGRSRLRLALQLQFQHQDLHRLIDSYVCNACQGHKLDGQGYGLLPPQDVKECMFDDVCVDLIGPWTINVRGRVCVFNALTCIDPTTNLVELV